MVHKLEPQKAFPVEAMDAVDQQQQREIDEMKGMLEKQHGYFWAAIWVSLVAMLCTTGACIMALSEMGSGLGKQ